MYLQKQKIKQKRKRPRAYQRIEKNVSQLAEQLNFLISEFLSKCISNRKQLGILAAPRAHRKLSIYS